MNTNFLPAAMFKPREPLKLHYGKYRTQGYLGSLTQLESENISPAMWKSHPHNFMGGVKKV